MGKQIFRKKSLQRISAPEEMTDFIRVSSPAVWLVMVAVFLLLAGAFVWGCFGTLETVVPAVAVSDGAQTQLYCEEENCAEVNEGDTVRVNDRELRIDAVADVPCLAGEVMDAYAMHLLGVTEKDWVYPAETAGVLPEGTAAAEIITEVIHPIRFFSSLND